MQGIWRETTKLLESKNEHLLINYQRIGRSLRKSSRMEKRDKKIERCTRELAETMKKEKKAFLPSSGRWERVLVCCHRKLIENVENGITQNRAVLPQPCAY